MCTTRLLVGTWQPCNYNPQPYSASLSLHLQKLEVVDSMAKLSWPTSAVKRNISNVLCFCSSGGLASGAGKLPEGPA